MNTSEINSDQEFSNTLETMEQEFQQVRDEFQRMTDEFQQVSDDFQQVTDEFQASHSIRLSSALDTHQGNPSWGFIQTSETEDCEFPPTSPSLMSDISEGELEEILLTTAILPNGERNVNSNNNDIDVTPLSRPQSALSLTGDSNGSPSTGSPTPLSPDSRESPDSLGPSDCENRPISPCHSPCYSRPGSPWPMFARPSFKKARSPFWTTFRVKEFR